MPQTKNLTEQLHDHLVAQGWENRVKKSGVYRAFIDATHDAVYAAATGAPPSPATPPRSQR